MLAFLGGTGPEGRGLALRFAMAGEATMIGSRDAGRAATAAEELRKAIVPDMIDGELSEQETERRWQHLEDMSMAQQMSLYPRRYLASNPTVDRMIETVERMEEALSGTVPAPPPMMAVVQVGDPLEVSPKRSKNGVGLLVDIESSLQSMLDRLSTESPLFDNTSGPDD